MSLKLPQAPEFGTALPVGDRKDAVLEFLALRRSASASALGAPGPDQATLNDLLRLAARVSDHGKLFPWRFIVLEGPAKSRFAERLAAIAAERSDSDKATSALIKLTTPPLAVAVISCPSGDKIPEWEQILSAGAVCTTLVNSASAAGFGANWITDWYSYDAKALSLLGLTPQERVAGFIYIGTAKADPLERVRPDIKSLTTIWEG
jgi:nitroreductase